MKQAIFLLIAVAGLSFSACNNRGCENPEIVAPTIGWVRISHLSGEQKLTIHDLGMNLISNQEIPAGKRNPF
jgi:hypothetical protein